MCAVHEGSLLTLKLLRYTGPYRMPLETCKLGAYKKCDTTCYFLAGNHGRNACRITSDPWLMHL